MSSSPSTKKLHDQAQSHEKFIEEANKQPDCTNSHTTVDRGHTCDIHVTYMCHTCDIHVSCMCHACVIHVTYMCHACVIHVSCMCHTGRWQKMNDLPKKNKAKKLDKR